MSSYKQLTNHIWIIPGHNPSFFSLCGTNVFIVGKGKRRAMIDAGNPRSLQFISLLKKFILEQDIIIDRIMVTHSHIDHLGGAADVIYLLQDLGQQLPVINRRHIETKFYRRYKERDPIIDEVIRNVVEGDKIQIDEDSQITVIETPGHTIDSICFLLESKGEETYLFTGDHILSTATTVYEDYSMYMDSLFKLSNMKGIDKLCVAHSHKLESSAIIFEAKSKIDDMIKTRESKDRRMLKSFKNKDKLSLHELYDSMYEAQFHDSKLAPYYKSLLWVQLQKFVNDDILKKEDGYYQLARL